MIFRILLLILTFLPLTGCDQFDPAIFKQGLFNQGQDKTSKKINNSERKKKTKTLPAVQVSTVKKRNLSYSATITGTLEANRSVKIFNQIEGLLIKLPFYEGDEVKKDQIIALLDKTLTQLELNKALVSEKQSSVNLNRITKLVPKNLVSQDELSQARTLLAIAKTETQKQNFHIQLLRHPSLD